MDTRADAPSLRRAKFKKLRTSFKLLDSWHTASYWLGVARSQEVVVGAFKLNANRPGHAKDPQQAEENMSTVTR